MLNPKQCRVGLEDYRIMNTFNRNEDLTLLVPLLFPAIIICKQLSIHLLLLIIYNHLQILCVLILILLVNLPELPALFLSLLPHYVL